MAQCITTKIKLPNLCKSEEWVISDIYRSCLPLISNSITLHNMKLTLSFNLIYVIIIYISIKMKNESNKNSNDNEKRKTIMI